MNSHLPQRPNLDHLRRQAKSLLAALEKGDKEAVQTIRQHLPAAKGMSASEVRKTRFCLADAQSAIARKSGFASWPKLARHVEQLRLLEGTWEFDSLEVDGREMPGAMLSGSRILIDGDRFRSETSGIVYEGIFNIDVQSDPHGIDIEFVAGPEAGNWNYGVFELDADQLKICLDMSGKKRPPAFATAPGSNCALERLRRASKARPEKVTGGTVPPRNEAIAVETGDDKDFKYVQSATLTRLQGEWNAVKLVHDGNEMPAAACKTGHRSAAKNELKVTFGGQLMIHARVRINENAEPVEVDYCHVAGPLKGVIQHGIMKWVGEEACFCMSTPGSARPSDFACKPGSGHTLSQWRAVKT